MRKLFFGFGVLALTVFGFTSTTSAEGTIVRKYRGTPDLRITKMSVSGGQVKVLVENIGQGGAPSSRVRVQMFKMVNGKMQLHASFFAMAPSVRLGARATGVATVTFPFNVANCTLVATVDYLGEITELNENNNKYTKVVH